MRHAMGARPRITITALSAAIASSESRAKRSGGYGFAVRVGAVPAGGGAAAAGEVAYRVAETVEVGLGLLYNQRRFRLDDSGPALDGVGEDNNLPLRLRLGWDVTPRSLGGLVFFLIVEAEKPNSCLPAALAWRVCPGGSGVSVNSAGRLHRRRTGVVVRGSLKRHPRPATEPHTEVTYMSHRLIIFGTSGDPSSRDLMPALARLHELGKLPPAFFVLSIAHDNWGTGHLREASERLSAERKTSREQMLEDVALQRMPTATARAGIEMLVWADLVVYRAWRLAESL